MLTNEDVERILEETLSNVEDPLTFTLTLLKWVQGLIVHGAGRLKMRNIDYLDNFLKLLNTVQRED